MNAENLVHGVVARLARIALAVGLTAMGLGPSTPTGLEALGDTVVGRWSEAHATGSFPVHDDATTETPGPAEAIAVPADAVLPEAGSGLFQPVGPGKTAKLVLRYGAMSSLFHDGTRTEAVDILYAFAFAYRWGAKGVSSSNVYDRRIAAATAAMRERLTGLRPVGVDKESKSFRVGELAFVREMLLFDVYLNAGPYDVSDAAALAPPWSSLPWHVTVLMEEAVTRGWGAFSQEEVQRRDAPWLDVVRDDRLKQRLAVLVEEFARVGFVPETLQGMVSPEEARARWQALETFYQKHQHFLVTNGPYVLKSWSGEATVLEVFRNASYPLGVGSYDAYAVPRRGYIADVDTLAEGLRVSAEIERIERFGRSHRIVREALASRGDLAGETLECRYLVVAPDGTVARTGLRRPDEDGTFLIDLAAGNLRPGQYTVLLTVILNGNSMDPDIRAVPYLVR